MGSTKQTILRFQAVIHGKNTMQCTDLSKLRLREIKLHKLCKKWFSLLLERQPIIHPSSNLIWIIRFLQLILLITKLWQAGRRWDLTRMQGPCWTSPFYVNLCSLSPSPCQKLMLNLNSSPYHSIAPAHCSAPASKTCGKRCGEHCQPFLSPHKALSITGTGRLQQVTQKKWSFVSHL